MTVFRQWVFPLRRFLIPEDKFHICSSVYSTENLRGWQPCVLWVTQTTFCAIPRDRKRMGTMEPRSLADIERIAERKMKGDEKLALIWNYTNMATGDRQTYNDSINAFRRWRFQPRILTAKPEPSLCTTVLGHPISMPVGISPIINYGFLHPDGAAVAGREKVPKDGSHWAQTYLYRDKRNTLDIVRQAERCGFKAIVVTVDSPVDEQDTPDIIDEYDTVIGKQAWCPNVRFLGGKERDITEKITFYKYWGSLGKRESVCHADWNDLAWLKSQTNVPIVLKGVLTGESARRAAEFGVAGIIVSAHGGRQLDGSPAPLDALPDVVDAVKGTNVEVYMDGGIRTGNDVVKALALGARAVFIGRPVLYGVAFKGEEGVDKVFEILRKELSISMSLNGCSSLQEITRSIVKHENEFHARL